MENKRKPMTEEERRERRNTYQREYMRRYRAANLEKTREYSHNYYLRNKDRIHAYQKEYKRKRLQQDPEYAARLNEYQRMYRETHKEQLREARRKKQLMRRKADA